ncbi:MAG: cation:proton antiporter [Haliea sp.]|nr:cation:proton antiporter [Haliea sp.]
MDQNLLYIIAAVLVLGVGAQWLSWRLRQPSILALLVLGIVAGPVTGLLRPDEQFGDLLFPMVSLGVALVLFEGGMTLKFPDLKGHGRLVTNMVSWGALLNWLLMAAGCWLLAAGWILAAHCTAVCGLGRGNRPHRDQPATAYYAGQAGS